MRIDSRISSAARYRLGHWRLISPLAIVVSFAFIACLFIQNTSLTPSPSGESYKATMSQEITIRVEGHDSSQLSFTEGHEIVTRYVGSEELRSAVEGNEARPVSLASGDFDEDGVTDLICGYSSLNGGMIALHRGNIDSRYPNSPEALRRKEEGTLTNAPFIAPGYLFSLPRAPDFLGVGDFNGDGRMDIVSATKYGRSLSLLAGDGHHGFAPASDINLPGDITAMAIGEVNRRDGLNDIVIAVTDAGSSSLLVFEGAVGALRASPEIFELPGQALSLAVAQLTGDHNGDIAAAAGHELFIIEGRDRKSYLPERMRTEAKAADISKRSFNEQILSIAVGDFDKDNSGILALLLGDKTIHVLGAQSLSELGELQSANHKTIDRNCQLIAAKVSGCATDDLIIWNRESNQTQSMSVITTKNFLAQDREDHERESSAVIESASSAAAMMRMQLNDDGVADLVILRSGSASPSLVTTRPHAIFSVTNTNDSGAGSLRQAIVDANQNPGVDTITFGIPGRRTRTIRLLSELPAITETVSIDATTQQGFNGSPIVELTDGSPSSQRIVSGLRIEAADCVVRGLAINSFSEGVGITIRTAAATGNHIEGCFIGTNVRGNSAAANAGGILIVNDEENPNTGAKRNIIGGTVPAARNLISGNRFEGIKIGPENGDTSENIIQGNLVGTNMSGTAALANGLGILILCPNNTVGGMVAGARNVVSGTRNDLESTGVLILSDSNIVQGNFLGTNQAGDQAIPGINGVVVDAGRLNTIGGTTAEARNIISGNIREGVGLLDSSDTLVQGNFIGTDVSGTQSIGNLSAGIGVARSPDTTLTGNVISNNTDQGVFVGFAREGEAIGQSGLFILNNIIGADAGGVIDMGNIGDGIFVEVTSSDNTIEGNIVAFNRGNGINIPNVTDNPGAPAVRISMLSNFIHSNDQLGINLGDDGVTKNDDKDIDQGANELQNFPVLGASSISAPDSILSGTVSPAVAANVAGTFNSTPNSTFTLQFYFGINCPTQGTQFVGFIPILIKTMSVNTDINGNADYEFAFELPQGQNGGFVNCTATDPVSNTSEISQCISVGVPQVFPSITDLARSGKKLFIAGENFDAQAKILINGNEQATKVESPNELLGKKAGKKLKPGDRIQVRNSDGKLSNRVTF
jgi:hypothetical protein